MLGTLAPPVKQDNIAGVQPMHHAREVGLACFQEQMKMIAYQQITMHHHPPQVHRLVQQLQPMGAVLVVSKNKVMCSTSG